MPCGKTNSPAPKLVTALPAASNLMIGARAEPAQELAPQRSATHTLVPSRSMSTALVEPHARPSGSVAQFSIERYGLGSEFFCPEAVMPAIAAPATTAAAIVICIRIGPSLGFD